MVALIAIKIYDDFHKEQTFFREVNNQRKAEKNTQSLNVS